MKKTITPRKTPWGKIQSERVIASGIIKITTSTHGGYYLSPEMNTHVPDVLRKATFGCLGEKGWYEEDVDWAIVVFVFPERFSENMYQSAIDSLKRFHQQSFEKAIRETK